MAEEVREEIQNQVNEGRGKEDTASRETGTAHPTSRTEKVSTRNQESRDTGDRERKDSRGSRDSRYSRGSRPRRSYFSKKVCRLCVNKVKTVDYKDVDFLRKFVTDRGKIMPRRMTGNCAKHQRMLAGAIKKARMVALLPFVSK